MYTQMSPVMLETISILNNRTWNNSALLKDCLPTLRNCCIIWCLSHVSSSCNFPTKDFIVSHSLDLISLPLHTRDFPHEGGTQQTVTIFSLHSRFSSSRQSCTVFNFTSEQLRARVTVFDCRIGFRLEVSRKFPHGLGIVHSGTQSSCNYFNICMFLVNL